MNIKEAAKEFGLYSQFGDWRLGYLVAACVERGAGGRGKTGVSQSRNSGKVSGNAFAKLAGTSPDRVLRYLDAWDKAAKADVVPEASGLSLSSRYTLPDSLPDWKDYYTSVTGGYNGGTTRQPSKKQAEVMLTQLPPKTAASVLAGALDTDEIIAAVSKDDEAVDHIFAVTTKLAGSRGTSAKKKASKSLREMTVVLTLIAALGEIRDLAQENPDSPLILECKSLMRETLEILDGIAEASDPQTVERMLADFGDYLSSQQ